MIKITYEVTLQYADETTWFVGAFDTVEAVDAWATTEQSRPYWQPETKIVIKEIQTEVPDAQPV